MSHVKMSKYPSKTRHLIFHWVQLSIAISTNSSVIYIKYNSVYYNVI